MGFLYRTYQGLTSGLFVFLLPAFLGYTRITGRHGRHIKERLGFIPQEKVKALSGSPRIWIHAVSLGEVKVADAVIAVLRKILPGCSLVVSMFTEHGRDMAKETFGEDVPVIFAPIDFMGSVRKALSTVRPDAMIFLETEIWPSWLTEAHRMGIKTALINGRISVRSVGGYLKLRPFFREVLKNFDAFSMILEEDAFRIRSMGADPQKITINGNAKYDLLESRAEQSIEEKMRRILSLEPSKPVFVAGSTREGEEEMILDVYEKMLGQFPETVLIIVPRHIERARMIAGMIEKRGFQYQLRTHIGEAKARRTEKIVIINTFGELFNIYSVGTLVFCGASLVPLGGQNPLEPAIWGKVIFYGPSMEDFLDAKALLESARAAVPVSGPEILAEKALWFLGHPEAVREYGERARKAAMKNQGAAERHARVIKNLLSDM